MWVCLCEAVTSRTIVTAIGAGAGSVKDIGEATGAGTVCNKCTPNIRVLIEQHKGDAGPDEKGWRWRRARRL
ncbi:MAG TPA: (2Fe-2S)-binding protein [Acidimicrobiales bacterium]|nr:(2Fe-2S)-binding protein [Acidimicrobiales bacterium]